MAEDSPVVYGTESAWWRHVPERYHDHPMFTYPGAPGDLPAVLLLGDSISMSYTAAVRERLDGEATVYRAPANCGHSRRTLAELETYLGDLDWSVIHANCGIHDVTLTDGDERTADGTPQIPLTEYKENLTEIVSQLKATGAAVIWASTTPVANHVDVRRDQDVVTYNEAAAEIMQSHNVPDTDLYRIVTDHPDDLWSDGVHFTEEGAAVLADAVVGGIQTQLESAETATSGA